VRRIRASGSSLIGAHSFSLPLLLIGVDSLLALALALREGRCTGSDGPGVSDFVETSGVAVAESDIFCRRVEMVDLNDLVLPDGSESWPPGGTELLEMKKGQEENHNRNVADQPGG
jgi:hypothetical protein